MTLSATGPSDLLSGLRRGWVLLPKVSLDGLGEAPVTIDLILLHAQHGVVLLELSPNWTPDAVGRLWRRLAQARFSATFSGHLPILHLPLRSEALAALPRTLSAGFAAEPPLTLAGGDVWVQAVSRILSGPEAAHGRAARRPAPGTLAALGLGLLAAIGLAVTAMRPTERAGPPALAAAEAPARQPDAPGPILARFAVEAMAPSPAMAMPLLAEPDDQAAAFRLPNPVLSGLGAEVVALPPDVAMPDGAEPVGYEAAGADAAAEPSASGAAPPAPAAPAEASIAAAPLVVAEPLLPTEALPTETSVATAPEPATPMTGPGRPPAAEAGPEPTAPTAKVEQDVSSAQATAPPDQDRPAASAAAPPAAEQQDAPAAQATAPPDQDRPAAAAAAPVRTTDPAVLAALIRRGDALLAIGDLSGARRFYERAAEAGSAEGASAAGSTHDPAVLATLGVLGIRPDPEVAAAWYRRAAALSALETRR